MDFDPEVAAIFTEEATELIEAVRARARRLARAAEQRRVPPALKRPLHTLKGGARMAGITAMGDLSHELETPRDADRHGAVAGRRPRAGCVQASLDELARMREQVAAGRRVAPAREMLERMQRLARPGAKAPRARPPPRRQARSSRRTAGAGTPVLRQPGRTAHPDRPTALESMLAKFNAELRFAGDAVAEVVANESAAAPAPCRERGARSARAGSAAPAPRRAAPATPRENPFAASSATALPFARSRLAGLSGEDEAGAAALPWCRRAASRRQRREPRRWRASMPTCSTAAQHRRAR